MMAKQPGSVVGIVGIGLLGTAIAQRLLAAGLQVAGYDVNPEARQRLDQLGGAATGDVAELSRRCAFIVISVFETAQVEDVVEGPGGVLSVPTRDRMALIAINSSTCEPDRIARLAERAKAGGLDLIELPISGSSGQVAAGDGVGLIGGDEAAAESAADVIAAITPRTFHMGAVGNGARAKLAINHILGLNRAALAEGLVLAERLALPLDAFLQAARGSAAYSQVMDVKGEKMIVRDFSTQGKVTQSLKDFHLIVDAAAARGQKLPLAEAYLSLMSGCAAAGEGEWDNCAVIEEIRRCGERRKE
jgi:3-hydroxyisobutyrate dehydrogenase-like beta-hydroxyacid dehydrogenase